MDIYHNGNHISGFEVTYLMDGFYPQYALHYKKKSDAKEEGGASGQEKAKSPVGNPLAKLVSQKNKSLLGGTKASKTSIYLNKRDYIVRLKVIGKDYLSYMEIETHSGEVYTSGDPKVEGSDYEFEIPLDFKVISFSGVLEA